MNDLYARDTSSKIKAVKLSTFKSGKYVGCYAPLGYRKSEVNKHVLEIDSVTAPVVWHIFDLRLQGYGFRKIALQLNAEKVPAPRSFYYMAEGRENLRGETPFWNDVTVKTILRNEVYIGHMVQNKTGTVSYKNHKQVSKPESEWIKVENTHEPLISQETGDAVQRMDNHPARGRSGKSGTIALFGGLLRCMDCGSSMRYMRDYRKKVSEKEPDDIIVLNKALIRMLQDRLRITRLQIFDTLEEEEKQINAYMTIQSYLCRNPIDYQFDIPEECMQLRYPKNVLQPFVENAIIHGILLNKDEHGKLIPGIIRIRIRQENGEILTEVEDNGKRSVPECDRAESAQLRAGKRCPGIQRYGRDTGECGGNSQRSYGTAGRYEL